MKRYRLWLRERCWHTCAASTLGLCMCVCVCVCLSVCYTFFPPRTRAKCLPTGSELHWLDSNTPQSWIRDKCNLLSLCAAQNNRFVDEVTASEMCYTPAEGVAPLMELAARAALDSNLKWDTPSLPTSLRGQILRYMYCQGSQISSFGNCTEISYPFDHVFFCGLKIICEKLYKHALELTLYFLFTFVFLFFLLFRDVE